MQSNHYSVPKLLRAAASLAATALLFSLPATLKAQTAGEGTISGTVTDTTGAVVPSATVTATNNATNVATQRVSSSAGTFTIAPVHPGLYTLTVEAPGFRTLKQENLQVDALGVLTVNPVMTVGATTETVEVTAAPPVLDTSTATLGLTIENTTYSNLPLQMNNAQRDPTAFATLAPGTQSGTRLPVIGGTGNYLGQLYLEGMPAETISQQGDNRLVGLGVSVEAVDQFQVITSTPPAEYMGAGAENFTMKSGGLKPHGQVSDFVRNTAFDAWSFTQKALTVKNAAGQTIPAPKPVEHQNELSASFGWKIPLTKDRGFFFVAYDKFHSRKGANPQLYTIPTTLMRTGDFTELGTAPFLYDPTTTACSGSTCTRKPFQGMKNGLPTNNVIPTSYLSPITQKMQSFLPAPTSSGTANNYLGGYPSGFDNWVLDFRVDYDLSQKQRISGYGAMGTEQYVNNYASPFIPPPYIGGDLAVVYPKNYGIEDTYTIRPTLINQVKYGFTRFFQNIHNATQGVTAWAAPTMGITNLPAGQAGEEFPGASFGTTPAFGTAQQTWTGNGNSVSTQLTTPNNYALVDNLQWLKGKHSFTFGISVQWQQINNANPATYTGVLDLAYNAFDTANFSGTTLSTGTAAAPSGYSYASYLLGAVGGTPSIGLQPVSELGGRYRPIAPYVEDSFKVNSKLTLDLGLRWDYLPPYREVKDRWTFLNPGLTNSLTGTPGELQFAGNYGGAGVSCGCTTPVHTYWKNWGPRVGIAYQADEKTVFRIGIGEVYTAAGGVGGRGGAYQGTGQTGFNVTAIGPAEVTSGAAANPSFYLNNGSQFTSLGIANTGLFGPGFVYPANPTPNAAAQTLNTGFYLNGAGKFQTASTVSYADPYFSGRAPELIFYNAGIQRALTKDMTVAVNYVGNESHFIVNSGAVPSGSNGNARGYWTNELNPAYLAALGGVLDSTGTKPLLIAAATPANVAILQQHVSGASIPASFQTAATVSTTATIAQGLTAFPQYSGVSDTWGNVGNFSYNSLQLTVLQRFSHGLSFNVNYTYSKNVGDDSTFRSGFDIPGAAVSGGGKNWKQDRIDRSWTTVSAPQNLHAFGVWQMPFGKGSQSFLVRSLVSGWQLSGIYTYTAGTPLAIIWNGCSGTNYPGQGQCMPDINQAYLYGKPARINGSYGTSPQGNLASNLGHIQYVDPGAFQTPQTVSSISSLPQYLIGNSPRTRAFNLNNPGTQDLDTSVRRSFSLPHEMALVFEVDCLNTWNKVTFSSPSATWSQGSTTFGTIAGISNSPRDFQFAGHFNF